MGKPELIKVIKTDGSDGDVRPSAISLSGGRKQTGRLPAWLCRRYHPQKLFLISFAILFLEMACIRWLNSTVNVLAYFNNLILISCFFGLGVGCLLASRKVQLIRWYSVVLLVFVTSVIFLDRFGIDLSYTSDVLFAEGFNAEVGLLRVSLAALAGFFVNVALFVVLGQELGKQLAAVGNPIKAYAYNIGGSLLGVLGYALMAQFGLPPHVWYGLGGAILLCFLGTARRALMAGLALFLACTMMQASYQGARWSPYYKINISAFLNAENRNQGFHIYVDGLRIQDALKFSPELLKTPLRNWWPYYQLPYHLTQPAKVLILGAGTGNDVVVALDHGAQEVHAVEIDPLIAKFGRTLHPQRPYRNKKVKVFVDDVRSFVSSTDETYDLIVMSALDSHKQVAGMSSLRLESFVYTVESFRKIRKLIAPGGIFVLNLSSTRPWMGERVYWSLTKAFGKEPRLLQSQDSPFSSVAYVYGPDSCYARDLLPTQAPVAELPSYEPRDDVRLCTDNWPHLYLQRNRIPGVCLGVLGVLTAAAVLLVAGIDASVRRPNLHFFFLGAGFMLLEANSVTQMALVFGATWNVNAIVFGSVLAAIFLVNHLVRMGVSPNLRICYGSLFLTLLMCYHVPFDRLLGLSVPVRIVVAAFIIGLPIVWAAFIFSQAFKKTTEANRAFGSNLLGTVLGGCLEYSSSLWGMDLLYLLALGLYLASLLALSGGRLPRCFGGGEKLRSASLPESAGQPGASTP